MKGLSTMKMILAFIMLLCVMAFALPVMASDTSPPGQAIEKHQVNPVAVTAEVAPDIGLMPAQTYKTELTATVATVKAHGALALKAHMRREQIRLRLQRWHEQTKYKFTVLTGEARAVLLC